MFYILHNHVLIHISDNPVNAVNTFQMKGYLELDGHRLNQTKDRIIHNKQM